MNWAFLIIAAVTYGYAFKKIVSKFKPKLKVTSSPTTTFREQDLQPNNSTQNPKDRPPKQKQNRYHIRKNLKMSSLLISSFFFFVIIPDFYSFIRILCNPKQKSPVLLQMVLNNMYPFSFIIESFVYILLRPDVYQKLRRSLFKMTGNEKIR